jgi:hypothetical protein
VDGHRRYSLHPEHPFANDDDDGDVKDEDVKEDVKEEVKEEGAKDDVQEDEVKEEEAKDDLTECSEEDDCDGEPEPAEAQVMPPSLGDAGYLIRDGYEDWKLEVESDI